MYYNRQRIGEILIKKGHLTLKQLNAALEEQPVSGERIGEILLRNEVIEERALREALAEQFELEFLDEVDIEEVDVSLSAELPIAYARKHKVMPLFVKYGLVIVATIDPLAVTALDHIRFLTGKEIQPLLMCRAAVDKTINSAYDRRKEAAGVLDDIEKDDAGIHVEDQIEQIRDLLESTGDDEAPIIQLVNTLFVQAIRERASDIHIEPFENYMSVRFRIDGVLREVINPPKRFQSSLITRVKIMANLNIAEKRLPQDGRIRLKIANKDIDIRVATAPCSYGERITMRLLDRSSILFDLGDIGFDPSILGTYREIIRRPHGILLVTGPTGSGKTTTLYGSLAEINSPDKNILTVEDPVEYQLDGISQMQVNSKIGLTFASGLRSYLRHDPDVIMVGEIRDVETVDIAIQASLTGHLVFSTVHTNDASGAFTRLIDMGVEPFLVASSVIAIIAQRLVRVLCPICKKPHSPSSDELFHLGLNLDNQPENLITYRAGGCRECFQTGYVGRTGIYEMLLIGEEVRSLVMQRQDAGTIKKEAVNLGMITLRDDGAKKVLAGITSIEEVMRVTQEDSA